MTEQLTEYLAEVRAREEAATPGPVDAYDNHLQIEHLKGSGGKILAEFFSDNPMQGDSSNDTHFYAHARTDVTILRQALEEALMALYDLRLASVNEAIVDGYLDRIDALIAKVIR